MLSELPERDASGEIARIYAEIRTLWGVPYVSSLQRHLATRSGWLEWAWCAVRPVFASGEAQSLAWSAAGTGDVPPLPALSWPALGLLDVDEAGVGAIANVCASFLRVSPVNLTMSGLLRALLRGNRPSGRPRAYPPWNAPEPLAAPPPMIDPALADEALRQVLLGLSTTIAGQPFVPGLYRMLAHWPRYLAHVATELTPRFHDPLTGRAFDAVLGGLNGVTEELYAALPPVPDSPWRPPEAEIPSVLDVLEKYRQTSPQMIVYSRLLLDALPLAPSPGRPR